MAVLANNQLTGYSYDAAGNMSWDPTDGVTSTYDQENRIATATKNGVTTAYTYDDDGNRVEKTSGGTGTLYWYMSPGIVAESDLAGNLQSEYVFFDGERLARKDFPGLAVSYYFSDHLKTASVITDAAGNITSESDYYPWGGELQFTNNDSNHYKFTGKERDAETGLDYFGARYYSNGLGRFVTPDWAAKATAVPYAEFADPQSLNLYSYVRNVPTTRFDADGHQCAGCLPTLPPLNPAESIKNLGKALANAGVDLLNSTMPMIPLTQLGVPAIPLPFPNAPAEAKIIEHVAPLAIPAIGELRAGATTAAAAETVAARPPLPEFNGSTTQGVLITNEGQTVPLESGGKSTYIAATHVEGKAALYIRDADSTGGVVYHNNPNGTCGYCNTQLPTLLPENSQLTVVPPADAVPNNPQAVAKPKTYTGNANDPKLPQ